MYVQLSHLVMSNSLRPHGLQHTRPPCPSPISGVYPNSSPLSWWCHQTISYSVVPYTSCLQSFPASWSLPMSQLFASGGHKYWSFSFSISPSNEYSGLISFRMDWLDLLVVQGLSRVFSSTTVQKHHLFFGWRKRDKHRGTEGPAWTHAVSRGQRRGSQRGRLVSRAVEALCLLVKKHSATLLVSYLALIFLVCFLFELLLV